MSMEQIQSQKVISIGGLNSNINHLQLSDYEPGSAISLLNFESSLYGGYRRLSGYTALNSDSPEVDPDNAEGRILVVAIYGTEIITARKQQSGNTYEFYKNDGSTWTKYTTGLTRNSLGVTRLRYAVFNFNGTKKIIFVDGVNPACVFDGTDWYEILTANTGASTASAGGNQAIENPEYVEVFKNHIFVAKNNLVVHSAPLSDYDWTAASGAGQIPTGFEVNQIKLWRDTLIVFGMNNIKKIEVSDTTFVLGEIAANIGCLASDSVLEVAGDLFFLAQDGFRPISGTNRIGDTELETLSRRIQPLIISTVLTNDLNEIVSVLIRGKSQVRTFFSSANVGVSDTTGIIGCIRRSDSSQNWEWGRLKGIRVACATSAYIGAVEFVLHGDYDGIVYRQEMGNSFAGNPVEAVYTTPYLDFGDVNLRKTLRKIKLFARPEGNNQINIKITYDWLNPAKLNPDPYASENSSGFELSFYGTAVYGTSIYSEEFLPVLNINVEGSGHSSQTMFWSSDTEAPYTIQGMIYEFSVEGKK